MLNSKTMKVCTPSFVKANMAKVLDSAFKGNPTLVFRKGRLAIIKEFALRDDAHSKLQAAFETGGGTDLEPTSTELKLIQSIARRK
jgi:hypothetical protein